jgi:hypothetical protein
MVWSGWCLGTLGGKLQCVAPRWPEEDTPIRIEYRRQGERKERGSTDKFQNSNGLDLRLLHQHIIKWMFEYLVRPKSVEEN